MQGSGERYAKMQSSGERCAKMQGSQVSDLQKRVMPVPQEKHVVSVPQIMYSIIWLIFIDGY